MRINELRWRIRQEQLASGDAARVIGWQPKSLRRHATRSGWGTGRADLKLATVLDARHSASKASLGAHCVKNSIGPGQDVTF
jgi:hypothetical protein